MPQGGKDYRVTLPSWKKMKEIIKEWRKKNVDIVKLKAASASV